MGFRLYKAVFNTIAISLLGLGVIFSGCSEAVQNTVTDLESVHDPFADSSQIQTYQDYEWIPSPGAKYDWIELPRLVRTDKELAIIEWRQPEPDPICARILFGVMEPDDPLHRFRYRIPSWACCTEEGLCRSIFHLKKLQSPSIDLFGFKENGPAMVGFRIERYTNLGSMIYDSSFIVSLENGSWVPFDAALTYGPLIDHPMQDRTVISFELSAAADAAVLLWEDGEHNSKPPREFRAEPFKTALGQMRYEVLLPDLKPGQSYRYRLRIKQKELEFYFPSKKAGDRNIEPLIFTTPPPPSSDQPVRFALFSDSRANVGVGEETFSGINALALSQISRRAYYSKAQFIMFVGDLIDGYGASRSDVDVEYQSWYNAIRPIGQYLPFFETVGNHEQFGQRFVLRSPEIGLRGTVVSAPAAEGDTIEKTFSDWAINPVGGLYEQTAAGPQREDRAAGTEQGPAKGPEYLETVYSFRWGPVAIIVLNSNYWTTAAGRRPRNMIEDTKAALTAFGGNREGYLMNHQLEWFAGELALAEADSDIKHIVLTFHEPSFPVGGHLQDGLNWSPYDSPEKGGLNDPDQPLGDVVDMRNRLWKVIASSKKIGFVFNGDEHNYSRLAVDSELVPDLKNRTVWQIVSGGCGAPFYTKEKRAPWISKLASFSGKQHFVLVTVDGDKIFAQALDADGMLIDEVESKVIR